MEGSGRGQGGPRSRGGGDGRGGGRGRSQYYRGGGGDGGGRGVKHLQGGGGDGDFGGGTGRGSRAAGQQKRFYRQSTSGGYAGCGGSGDYSPDLWQRSAQPYTQQSPGGGGGRVGSGRSRGYGGGGGRGSSSSYHQQARHLRGNHGPESGGVSSVRDWGPGEISVGGRGYLTGGGGGEGCSARSSCGSWGQAPQPAAPGCTRLRFWGCGGVKPRWYTSVEVSDKIVEQVLHFLFACISFIVSKVIDRQ